MNTILLIFSLTITTCCTISDGVRFRMNPFFPDAQNIQPTGQPTIVLMQMVVPVLRLMHTVSMQ